MVAETDENIRLLDRSFQVYAPDGEQNRIRYAICMLQLQDLAGLTYKEARTYLAESWEGTEDLQEDLALSDQAFRNLYKRSHLKVANSGFTEDEIFGEYRLPRILID